MKSTLDLFIQGSQNLIDTKQAEEKLKVGTLRAGNTGVLTPTGKVAGTCHRKTFLRYKGIELEPEDISRKLMFDAGNGNEDLWVNVLEAAQEPGLVLRREEELGLEWNLPSGQKVSGRPDIVLGKMGNFSNSDGTDAWTPVRGIELKLVSSLWTARDVLLKGKPKTIHLMQAGHYAWKLGVPFEIWYSNRTTFAITDYSQDRFFARKNFPKPGEPLSEYCKYNEKGQILSVEPFIVGYEVRWNNKGQLVYSQVGSEKVVHTFITQQGIEDYYSLVARMEKEDYLGPRPENLDADGEPAGYDLCDSRYCPLASTCDNHEKKGLANWLEQVKKVVDTGTGKK